MSTDAELGMLMINLSVLEGLVRRLGNCDAEMEAMARQPEFEGKRLALVALEAVRYMHARLYVTAPLIAPGQASDPQAAALVQLSAMKLDDCLAPLVAADLIATFSAKYVRGVLRDQIAMRDEHASTRLEVPRTLAAIATLGAPAPEVPPGSEP
jgi:hypothetical protein